MFVVDLYLHFLVTSLNDVLTSFKWIDYLMIKFTFIFLAIILFLSKRTESHLC